MADYQSSMNTQLLLDELKKALANVRPYGSIEIIVQNNQITQITARNIRKTTGIAIDQL